jgi:NAD(P)H-flavin reductase
VSASDFQVFSSGSKRYVQTVLEEEIRAGLIKGVESKTGVLLCGQKDMCTAVTALLTDAGVSKERILLNF